MQSLRSGIFSNSKHFHSIYIDIHKNTLDTHAPKNIRSFIEPDLINIKSRLRFVMYVCAQQRKHLRSHQFFGFSRIPKKKQKKNRNDCIGSHVRSNIDDGPPKPKKDTLSSIRSDFLWADETETPFEFTVHLVYRTRARIRFEPKFECILFVMCLF